MPVGRTDNANANANASNNLANSSNSGAVNSRESDVAYVRRTGGQETVVHVKPSNYNPRTSFVGPANTPFLTHHPSRPPQSSSNTDKNADSFLNEINKSLSNNRKIEENERKIIYNAAKESRYIKEILPNCKKSKEIKNLISFLTENLPHGKLHPIFKTVLDYDGYKEDSDGKACFITLLRSAHLYAATNTSNKEFIKKLLHTLEKTSNPELDKKTKETVLELNNILNPEPNIQKKASGSPLNAETYFKKYILPRSEANKQYDAQFCKKYGSSSFERAFIDGLRQTGCALKPEEIQIIAKLYIDHLNQLNQVSHSIEEKNIQEMAQIFSSNKKAEIKKIMGEIKNMQEVEKITTKGKEADVTTYHIKLNKSHFVPLSEKEIKEMEAFKAECLAAAQKNNRDTSFYNENQIKNNKDISKNDANVIIINGKEEGVISKYPYSFERTEFEETLHSALARNISGFMNLDYCRGMGTYLSDGDKEHGQYKTIAQTDAKIEIEQEIENEKGTETQKYAFAMGTYLIYSNGKLQARLPFMNPETAWVGRGVFPGYCAHYGIADSCKEVLARISSEFVGKNPFLNCAQGLERSADILARIKILRSTDKSENLRDILIQMRSSRPEIRILDYPPALSEYVKSAKKRGLPIRPLAATPVQPSTKISASHRIHRIYQTQSVPPPEPPPDY